MCVKIALTKIIVYHSRVSENHPSVVSGQTPTSIPHLTPTPPPIPLGMLLYTYRGHSSVTGDTKYGTEDNIVVLETQHIHAYVALPALEERTEFFPPSRFRYDAERHVYLCPAGKNLHDNELGI